jgi:hypothetical protein
MANRGQDARGEMCARADALSRRAARTRPAAIAEAERLYRASFRGGYATAGYNLACLYRVLGRHREAVRWYRRAHAAGDPSALLQIGLAELYGVGTTRDPVAAFAKLRRMARSRTVYAPAAHGENVEAMLILASALQDGWLLPHDYHASQRWLRRASAWGSPTARAILTGR